MTRSQAVAAVLAVAVVVVVIELVRRRRLSEEFSLLWIVASLGAAALALWTNLLRALTRALGALYETSTIFFFGLLFVMVVLIFYAVKLTRLGQEARRLAQDLALLRRRMEEERPAGEAGPEPGQRTGSHP
jgi:hypothetical protein